MAKIRKVKLRYISDQPSVFFKKGETYEGYRAKDDPRGLFWCIYLPDADEPGDYGVPAQFFEIVSNDKIRDEAD